MLLSFILYKNLSNKIYNSIISGLCLYKTFIGIENLKFLKTFFKVVLSLIPYSNSNKIPLIVIISLSNPLLHYRPTFCTRPCITQCSWVYWIYSLSLDPNGINLRGNFRVFLLYAIRSDLAYYVLVTLLRFAAYSTKPNLS